jgi:hypothetical protein
MKSSDTFYYAVRSGRGGPRADVMPRLMYIQAVSARFVQKSLMTLMTRAILEKALALEA